RVEVKRQLERASRAPFRRTPALRCALNERNASLPRCEQMKLTEYYKRRKLCQRYTYNVSSIAAAMHRSTFRQTRFADAVYAFTDAHLLRFYARKDAISQGTLYKIMEETHARTGRTWIDPKRCPDGVPADLMNELLDPRIPMEAIRANPEKRELLVPVPLPSWGWCNQYIRWFLKQPGDGREVITARYGAQVWENEHLLFDRFARYAAYPLQYVFADHTLLNVFAVDDETRSRLDRLWLTVLIDVYSRCPLGIQLQYETPCIESIQGALRHAIWPKVLPDDLARGRLWAAYGIPLQLSLDNAWAHQSHSLEHLARQISRGHEFNTIDLLWRPPYKARYGALIERFFRTLKARLATRLPGAFATPDRQAVRNAAREACLLYDDIWRGVVEEILDYLHTPHSELEGLTPHEKWVESLQVHGPPLIPALTPEVERLFWRRESAPRVISTQGICAFSMHYTSPILSRLERIDKAGQPVPYAIHVDSDSIGQLALFRDGEWQGDVFAKELKRPDGSLRRMRLCERRVAFDLVTTRAEGSRQWLAYLKEGDELTQQRQEEKRMATRGTRATRRRPGTSAPRHSDTTHANERQHTAQQAPTKPRKPRTPHARTANTTALTQPADATTRTTSTTSTAETQTRATETDAQMTQLLGAFTASGSSRT
ncbi:MAG: hypothetical protein ACXWQR_18625, partial [Ktedonobacterales bacterium]